MSQVRVISKRLARGFAGETAPMSAGEIREYFSDRPGGSEPPRCQIGRVTDWSWPWWEWGRPQLSDDFPVGYGGFAPARVPYRTQHPDQ